MLKSNTGIAIIVKEWNHQLHSRSAKCPVHLILLDFVILKFIALYTTRSSLRWVCFAFVYKVGHNAHENDFSGTDAKVRKETISFVVFVSLRGTTRLPLDGFSWNLLSIYRTLSRKFEVHWNLKREKGTSDEDVWTFMITRWILLRMRNVSDKICREDQKHILC